MPLIILCSQDWLQVGYVTFANTIRWFFKKAMEMEYEEYAQMLKMVGFCHVNDHLTFAELLS